MTTRKITLSAAALLMAAAFAGCSGNTTSASSNSSSAADSSAADSTASDSTASKLDTDITVVSREDGSGTRGAFVELMGIEQKNEAGEKEDMTRGDAEISNSTNGVMMSVAGNVDAIGYISLGSLNDTVKALDVNGVECSVAGIKSGDYVVARPFNVCYQQAKLDGNAAAKDLIAFIESDDGQKIIADNGYIAIDSTGAYAPSGVTGAILPERLHFRRPDHGEASARHTRLLTLMFPSTFSRPVPAQVSHPRPRAHAISVCPPVNSSRKSLTQV